MEIGNQIRSLRVRRGVTQEVMASALGVSTQTVSKWETGTNAPDISLLPEISAYFGVTIDELFALTDETRMERIENLLRTYREADNSVLDREAEFLLEKARRDSSDRAYTLLAYLENYRADAHRRHAAEYAKAALALRPDSAAALWELAEATGLREPYYELADSHREIIDYFSALSPKTPAAYHWLLEALLADSRFGEAGQVCRAFEKADDSWEPLHYRGLIAWRSGDRETALNIWKQMLERFPEDEFAWGVYAEDYAMTGDYAGAVKYIEKARSLQAEPTTTFYETGAYYRELAGDISGAIADLEALLSLRASWGYTGDAGEAAYRREIRRLKEKL